MTTSDVTRDAALTLAGTGEFLETLPYLLGFRPEASVVLAGLDDDRLVVTTRIDLADAGNRAETEADVNVLIQAGATRAILVVFAAPADPSMRSAGRADGLPHARTANSFAQALLRHDVMVIDLLYVQQGRWWSYVARSAGCPCCVDGSPLPGDSATGPAAAVFAGMQAQPSRAALCAVLDPDPDAAREQHHAGLRAAVDASARAIQDGRGLREQRSIKRALFAAAREADSTLFPRTMPDIAPAVLYRYAVGLRDITIRDALWLAVDQARLDGRGFWLALLQQVPAPYDCAPLFLFGWATWRDGNGTLAATAAERALASDPDYTAAELLLNAVRGGLDPFRTPRLHMPRR